MNRKVEIVCHRGANEYAPENTYASAQLCIDWGMDYVEISNSRFGIVSPVRTAHKPKRGDSVRVDGPRVQKTGLQIGILTSLILPDEASGYAHSGN
jgi:hypothetical protein